MAFRSRTEAMNEETTIRSLHHLGLSFRHGLGVSIHLPSAVKWFSQAADRGFVPSKYELALLLRDGHGVIPREESRALGLLHAAAESKYAPALTTLSTMYRFGRGVEKNHIRAISFLRTAVALNHGEAIVLLADCHRDGIGVPKDVDEAVRLYREGIKLGVRLAHTRLGECFRAGISVEQNDEMAFRFFDSAAMQRESSSYFQLAKCYARGLGVKPDMQTAFTWFRRAADEARHPRAAAIVARCFEVGSGVDKCSRTAASYWKIAADAGFAEAKIILAECYAEGIGVEKNEKLAFDLFQSATDDAEPMAFVGLGECYLDGFGVEKDAGKGIYMLRKAINQGSAHACLVLARRHLHGRGVEHSPGEAVKCFLKAINIGSPEANYALALCHFRGCGVSVSPNNGIQFLSAASDAGHVLATVFLARCIRYGVGTTQDVARAFKLTQKAAKTGEKTARRDLALCYLRGAGCEPDFSQARATLSSLSQQHDPVAMRYLADFYAEGKMVPQDWNAAAAGYSAAADKQDPVAIRRLAMCLRDGLGTPRCLGRVPKLLKSAIELKDKGAIPILARCHEEGLGVDRNLTTAISYYERARKPGEVLNKDTEKACTMRLLLCYSQISNDDNIATREAQLLQSLKDEKSHCTETRLAYLLHKGIGVPQDNAKGAAIIEQFPKEKRTWLAMRVLASCYMPNRYHTQTSSGDISKVLDVLRASVDLGFVDGKLMLGKQLLQGLAGESEIENGIKLLEEASEGKLSLASVMLGDLYSRGHVRVKQSVHGKRDVDHKKAVEFYKKGVDNAYGMYRLARSYMFGRGVERSEHEAIKLVRSAAKKNCALAQLFMCQHFEHGTMGMPVNHAEALRLYGAAVHRVRGKTRGRAMYRYGTFLRIHGTKLGLFATPAKASERVIQVLSEAKLGRCQYAVNDLAVQLAQTEKKKEPPQELDEPSDNSKKAFELFEEAANQLGIPRALSNVGICYDQGIGVKQDRSKARELYELAAAKADPIGQNNLALCLIDEGKNEEAFHLLQKAADQKDVHAIVNLGRLYERGEGVTKDVTKAFSMYKDAAELSSAEGCANMASCYQDSIGTDCNEKLAIELYKKAESLGCAEATRRLSAMGNGS